MFVIDPGHGGRNVGALDGYENLINLDVSLSAWSVAVGHLGLDCKLTRTCETDVSWQQRQMVTTGADYVISIHHNASTNPDVCGIQLYHWPDNARAEAICRSAHLYSPEDLDGNVLPIAEATENYPGARHVCGVYSAPTILVECAYLTNADDLAFVQSKWYVNRMGLFVANLIVICEEACNGC